MAAAHSRTVLTTPRLIVCEGDSDAALFRELIVTRALRASDVRHAGEGTGDPRGGINKFGTFLQGIQTWNGFAALTDILLVADNDMDPARNFQLVCDQIANVPAFGTPLRTYPVPAGPQMKSPGAPSITILMIPASGVRGNLDGLCFDAAVAVSPAPFPACVDAFAVCAGADRWTDSTKLGEMKLRSLLAVRYQKDPSLPLRFVWSKDPSLIPVRHATFDPIAGVVNSW